VGGVLTGGMIFSKVDRFFFNDEDSCNEQRTACCYSQSMLSWMALVIAAGWQSRGTVDGMTVETRPIEGSAYESIRVTKEVSIPAQVLADAIWGTSGPESVASKAVHEHRVVEDGPGSRVYYEVVAAPLISDRDYILRIDRHKDGEVHEVRFHSIEHPKYPPQDGKVRMRVIGTCVIEPTATGGSIVTYEVFADIGGSIPAWIARGAQRDSSLEWVKTMITRAEKLHASLQRGGKIEKPRSLNDR
jgi:hypothetical protein